MAHLYTLKGVVRSCRGRERPVGLLIGELAFPKPHAKKAATRVYLTTRVAVFHFMILNRNEVISLAIYHLSIQIISRGKGKSAVSAAAYRSGEKIKSDYDGMTHDYTRKGGIVHTEILLPDNAPSEYKNRSALWNAVEQIEKNSNSQLAREIEFSLPKELPHEQHLQLVREYCQKHFVSAGMIADICFHTPKPKEDENENPHVHIMLTMRPFEQDGTWGAKSKKEYILDDNSQKILLPNGEYKTRKINTTDWNGKTKAEEWRRGWADVVNRFLEQNGVVECVDHRSYERQGVDQIPTVHMGVAATRMERRGIATDRGNMNRQIIITNKEIRQLKARIVKLEKWLKEENENTTPSTLADVITDILNRQGQSSVSRLKVASQMLIFLQENEIIDMAGLETKIKSMLHRQADIREKLKPMERRLKTLDEHIKQADIYFKHKAVYSKYKQLQKPKDREAFADVHRAEITLYEAAAAYLKDVMNGHTTIPTKAWRAERDKLIAERNGLNREYLSLKNEVKKVEQIRRGVHDVLREENIPDKARCKGKII